LPSPLEDRAVRILVGRGRGRAVAATHEARLAVPAVVEEQVGSAGKTGTGLPGHNVAGGGDISDKSAVVADNGAPCTSCPGKPPAGAASRVQPPARSTTGEPARVRRIGGTARLEGRWPNLCHAFP